LGARHRSGVTPESIVIEDIARHAPDCLVKAAQGARYEERVGARGTSMGIGRRTAKQIATALVGGPWERGELYARAAHLLDATPDWLIPMERDVLALWPRGAPPTRILASFLLRYSHLRKLRKRLRIVSPHLEPPPMRTPIFPVDVPDLRTWAEVGELAGLSPTELAWLTEPRPLEPNVRHHHYVFRWQAKASGAWRLLEAPRPKLKAAQRALLHRVLDRVSVHDAAHGFVRGRSPLTFAAPHTGAAVVVRLDLADFFVSIRASRVFAIFESLGYPEDIARLLVRLTTAVTPEAQLQTLPRPVDSESVNARFEAIQLYRDRHMPQGAPTSPALANLAALGLDRRLAGVAKAFHARYTRYADDLAFSGDAELARKTGALIEMVRRTVREEGFELNVVKTRVMRASAQQRLTGLVINDGVGVARRDRKALEAILFNALRTGLDAQNREGHPHFLEQLRGRVAHVAHSDPRRAKRLVVLFERVLDTCRESS